MRLFDLPQEFRQWSDSVEEAGGELTPEMEGWLAALEATLEQKCDMVCSVIRESEQEAVAFRQEAASFAAKAKVAENRARRLKELLLTVMENLGMPKVEGRLFKASVGKAPIPSIRWTFSGTTPEEFRRVTIDLDGQKTHEAFRAGTLPPGFDVTYAKFLRIR